MEGVTVASDIGENQMSVICSAVHDASCSPQHGHDVCCAHLDEHELGENCFEEPEPCWVGSRRDVCCVCAKCKQQLYKCQCGK